MGRFLTPDPYEKSGKPDKPPSWNRYSYVGNDPVDKNDPTGLEWGVIYTPPSDDTGMVGNGSISNPMLELFLQRLWYASRDAYRLWGIAGETPDLTPAGGGGGNGGGGGGSEQPRDTRQQLLNDCIQRKQAEAQQARDEYIQQMGGRLATSAELGAARGAIMGSIAGATGFGGMSVGLTAVPGAILGGIVGGQIGGAGGALSGLLQEPFWRLWYDLNTFRPALERASIDCAIEILGRPPE